MSSFWSEMMVIAGIDHHLSTAYHPQTDGQYEVLNRCLESYLRCMCHEMPQSWSKWLPLAEYWYNTTYHTSIQTTPFEVLYGQPPPLHLPYVPGDRTMIAREQAIETLKHHLQRSQNRMRQFADRHRKNFFCG